MLFQLLGFPDQAHSAGLAWHQQILHGFPRESLASLSAALKITQEELAVWCDVVHPSRKPRLSAQESASLFQVAKAYHRLLPKLKQDDKVRKWLTTPNLKLDQGIPMSLLLTQPGADAVFLAIDRIEVPTAVIRYPEAPPYREDDDDYLDRHDPLLPR